MSLRGILLTSYFATYNLSVESWEELHMHITMPDTRVPVEDLYIALRLLDESAAGCGIDVGTSYLWPDFKKHRHEIVLCTSFRPNERGKEWTYQVTDEIVRLLIDNCFVEDHSEDEDGVMYAISDDGIRERERRAKLV